MATRIHRFRRLRLVRDEPREELIEPNLAARLRRRLIEDHEHLASTIDGLHVVDRCNCGEAGCQSFYTVSERQARWLWRNGGRTIPLEPGLSVDVVNGLIVAIEVIDPVRSRS